MESRVRRQRGGIETRRFWRAALFASTGLSAVLALPSLARAQIDPATTPQGGTVTAGSASITQAPGSTTIDQTSQRTAINWQSFNVGANAQVQFNQPNATAIALNRVTGGDLSQIYGKIDANGQIILINQSGVIFAKGSQINAESIVVSTANVSDKSFMAGTLNFTGGSNPGAKIINDGNITAKQAGLVGLVAPQVSNSGVITAELGQVVLAGATAFTLDMYGDRLISLDVTQAVRSIDLDGKAVPALVTNSGIIIADGGKITLTAEEADALVTQLIDAGGTIRADTVGSQTGAISLSGVGGNIQIAGNLLAQGTAAGGKGGTIEADATGTVAVAASAVADASGDAGGGVIAIGTDIARAETGASDTAAPKAAAVSIASGAVLKADATGKGNGGTVTLLSTQNTAFQGEISVQGGPQGGNGGLAEISSDGVISLGGTVLATAVDGTPGEILLDPLELLVSTAGAGSGSVTSPGTTTFGTSLVPESIVNPSQLNSLSGVVILEGHDLVSVASAIDMTSATALSLVTALGDVSITASIFVEGSLEINAGGLISIGAGLTAADISASAPSISLTAADITAGATATPGTLALFTDNFLPGATADVLTAPGGTIQIAPYTGLNGIIVDEGGDAALGNLVLTDSFVSGLATADSTILLGGTAISGVISIGLAGTDTLALGTATLDLLSAGAVDEFGTLTAGTIEFGGAGFDEDAAGSIAAGLIEGNGSPITGNVVLRSPDNSFATIANMTVTTPGDEITLLNDSAGTLHAGGLNAASITLQTGGSLVLNGNISAATALTLASTAGDISQLSGTIGTGSLTVSGDAVTLAGNNAVTTLGNVSATDFNFTDAASLSLAGQVSVSNNIVLDDTGTVTIGGSLQADNASLSAGSISIAGYLTLSNALTLDSTGAVTEAGTGTITALTLTTGTGTVGSAALFSTHNTINTIAGFALGGDLAMSDAVALTISNLITTTGDVTLTAPGITEVTGGIIDADVLSGGSGAAHDSHLGNANDIISLGSFTARNLVLTDNSSLGLSGLVSATDATFTDDAGIGELTGGTIDVTTLNAAASAGDILLANSLATTIGTIGNVSIGTGGTLDIADASGLTILGPVVGPVTTLVADGLTFIGNVTATGTLALGGGGTIAQTGGSITAGTLIGAGIFTEVSLAGANSISNIGDFADAGTLVLNNPKLLSILGTVSASQMTLSGTTLTEGASGVLDTATLTTGAGSFTGAVSLGGGNSITTLSSISVDGDFSLNDATDLTIAASLAAPDIFLGAPSLAVNATVAAGLDGTLALAFDSISTDGGTLLAPSGTIAISPFSAEPIDIGGSLAGALNLGPAFIDALDPTADAIVIGGAGPDRATAITIGADSSFGSTLLELVSSGGINDAATLTANTLGFDAAGFTQSGTGALIATLLQGNDGTLAGDVILDKAANNIGTLGNIDISTNNVAITDGTSLDVTGTVSGQNITLIDASTINLGGGTLAAGAAGAVSLVADNLTGSTGQISGGTLAVAPFTGLAIDLGGTSASDLDLSPTLLNLAGSGTALQIGKAAGYAGASIVETGSVSLTSDAITLIGSGITFNGALYAGTADSVLELASSGPVSEAADGTISVATLISASTPISGNVSLLGGNTIGTLGSFSATGNIAFKDTSSLDIAGLIDTPDILTLEDSNPGGIHETAITGAISAATLNSGGTSIGGDVSLTSGVTIAALGGFTLASGNTLTLDDTRAFAVTGALHAGTASLSAPSITFASDLDLSTLALATSIGGVTQTSGTATITSLTGSLATDLLLGDANSIASLGSLTAGGTILVSDAGSLTIAGPIVGNDASFSAGDIGITGNIRATNTLALASTGTILQSGGTITAGTLTSGGTADGDVALNDANSITLLGSFTGSGLTLADAAPLTIDGAVSLSGDLALFDPGAITQTGGSIIATSLTSDGQTIGSTVNLGQTGNTIQAIGSFASGGLSLDDTGTLFLAGDISTGTDALNLVTTGDIIQTEGGVTAGSFGGSAANISLEQPGNAIVALGGITTGALDVAGAASLTGPVNATSADLSNGGDFILAGPASISGSLTINSGGTLLQTAGTGTVQADNAVFSASNGISLSGSMAIADALDLQTAGNIVHDAGTLFAGTLDSGGTTIGGDVALTSGVTVDTLGGLTLAGAGTLTLIDTGSLTVAGALHAGTGSLTAAGITLNSNLDVPAALILDTTGTSSVEQISGIITTDLLAGSIAGAADLIDPNAITTLGSLTTGGNFTLNNAQPLTIGSVLFSPGTVALQIAGNVTETGAGAIDAAQLSTYGTGIGGTATLNNGNSIATLAAFTGTGLTLADAAPLTIDGAVSLSGDLALYDPGAITQTGGSIIATSLTSDGQTIGGAVSLGQGSNQVQTIGDFASGGLSLDDTGTLFLAGDILTGTDALNLVTTGGDITQTGGSIVAAVYGGSADNISLELPGNTIGALGTITTGALNVAGAASLTGPVTATSAKLSNGGNFTLAGAASIAQGLTVDSGGTLLQTADSGLVQANNAVFTASNGISLSGDVSIANELDLFTPGNIIHAAGTLDAGTMTGTAGSLASFTGLTDFQTLGSFTMTDSQFILDNDGPLYLAGPLTATDVTINAQGDIDFAGLVNASVVTLDALGTLTLDGAAGGSLNIIGAIETPKSYIPIAGKDSAFVVSPDDGIALIEQTGTFGIDGGSASKTSPPPLANTLFLSTTSGFPAPPFTNAAGGNIVFNDLNAPSTNLVVQAGNTGIASGLVDLYRVVILDALRTDLTGELDNIGGQAGAGKGVVVPYPNGNFRFNACPIGSVNCTILPIDALPPGNPLQNFDIEQRKKKRLNHNIQLPGIATRDF